MMRVFKNFWKDYGELCKMSGKWYKKHWKGYIVLSAAIIATEFAWFFRDDIKDKINDKIESRKSKKGVELK